MISPSSLAFPRCGRASLGAVLLAIVVGAGACGAIAGDDCTNDPTARHFAENPATGACWEFTSSCDVPEDWADCDSCSGPSCPPPPKTCASDDDCVLTQHCDYSRSAPADPVDVGAESDAKVAGGTCVDNVPCDVNEDCPLGQYCDYSGSGDCDPAAPGCGGGGAPEWRGICTRGFRPPPPPPPPPPGECVNNADCGSQQVCPATYGWCGPVGGITPHPAPPTDALQCTSTCQDVCYDDSRCAPGYRCNNLEVCAIPNPKPAGARLAIACGGWCIPSP